MIKHFKDLFRAPSPVERTRRELEKARADRYDAVLQRERAASAVIYHDDKIDRLAKILDCAEAV